MYQAQHSAVHNGHLPSHSCLFQKGVWWGSRKEPTVPWGMVPPVDQGFCRATGGKRPWPAAGFWWEQHGLAGTNASWCLWTSQADWVQPMTVWTNDSCPPWDETHSSYSQSMKLIVHLVKYRSIRSYPRWSLFPNLWSSWLTYDLSWLLIHLCPHCNGAVGRSYVCLEKMWASNLSFQTNTFSWDPP